VSNHDSNSNDDNNCDKRWWQRQAAATATTQPVMDEGNKRGFRQRGDPAAATWDNNAFVHGNS